jgi:serine/threonine protein kinase
MGVIIYFLLSGGFYPFEGRQIPRMIRLVGPLPSRWHEKWLSLIAPDDPMRHAAQKYDKNIKWLSDMGIVDEEAKVDKDKADKILRRIFQHEPEMRASAQEIAEALDDMMTGLDIEEWRDWGNFHEMVLMRYDLPRS